MVRRRRSRSTASEPSGAHDTETPEDSARRLAYRYLARAARSASEVGARLGRHGFAPDIVARTLQELRDLRYVDDLALARRYAEDLLLRRGCGRLRVAHELTRRGLADSVIETAIAETLEDKSDEQLARAALGRRLRDRPLAGSAERARVFRFLIGRGHPLDVVGEILGEDN